MDKNWVKKWKAKPYIQNSIIFLVMAAFIAATVLIVMNRIESDDENFTLSLASIGFAFVFGFISIMVFSYLIVSLVLTRTFVFDIDGHKVVAFKRSMFFVTRFFLVVEGEIQLKANRFSSWFNPIPEMKGHLPDGREFILKYDRMMGNYYGYEILEQIDYGEVVE